MENHDVCIGIDLGTTQSALAWGQFNPKRNIVESRLLETTRLVELTETGRRMYQRDSFLPSCVYFPEDVPESVEDALERQHVIIGDYAKWLLDQSRVVTLTKLDMGTSERYEIGTKIYTPEVVSSLILKRLKLSAESTIFRNKSFPENVAISVPSAFINEESRTNATIRAAELAGFKRGKITIVEESIAALHDFHNRRNAGEIPDHRIDFSTPKLVLVFDLGGGTLDVSLHQISISRDDLIIDTIDVSRFIAIGGHKFDVALRDFLFKVYQEKINAPFTTEKRKELKNQFLLYAEDAKIELSNRSYRRKIFQPNQELDLESITFDIDIFGNPPEFPSLSYKLSLEEYKKQVNSLLGPNLKLTELTPEFMHSYKPPKKFTNIIDPILEALKRAERKLGKIPKPEVVLLNGSMAKFHIIQERLREFFQIEPYTGGDMDRSVARGAVIYLSKKLRTNH